MSPSLEKILNALEKADSIPAKEKERIRKELEKTEKTLHKKDTLLSAQARELEIETALEKVRARSMAMHNSEEIAQVAATMFLQLTKTGINDLRRCVIYTFNRAQTELQCWYTTEDGKSFAHHFSMPLKGSKVIHKIVRCWKSGKPISIEVSGSLYTEWGTFIRKHGWKYPKGEKPANLMLLNEFPFKYGLIEVATYSELKKEDHVISARFTQVFEQVYTRFLDLQKAEAQVREAQIEGALERVRTRTMAMHRSDELAETALVLYKQFSLLGNIPDRMSIGIFKEDTRKLELWPTDQSGSKLNKKFAGSWERSPIMIKIYKAWKAKDNSHVADLSGQDLKEWLKFIREEVKLFVDDTHIKGRRVQQAAFFSHGFLLITTNEPIADEIMQLLIRFAGVFSQTYTRFLDLQKAEAQAHEARIETALERVRSRSMAMHESTELSAIAYLLFKQLKTLGFELRWCWFSIFDEEFQGITSWYTDVDGNFNSTPIKQKFKNFKDVNLVYMAYKSNQSYHLNEIKGQALVKYVKELGEDSEFKKGISYPIFQKNVNGCLYQTQAFFKNGYIGYSSFEPRNNDNLTYFCRFAKVFEQTYTRFLDLQKAEAQAREAQIEAALEKVRSQSLAMHTTAEMQQVANAVYDQLHELGIKMDAVGMSGVIEAKQDYDVWIGGAPMGKALRIPYNEDTKVQRDYNKAIKDRADLFARSYKGKVKEEYINHLLTHGEFPKVLKKKMVTSTAFSTSIAFAKNSGIQIARYTNEPYTAEENELLKRFARVFEQAYIRFMDLQKAEAQAREAQIEGALERIRSKTMAMHNSDDMEEIVISLFDEVLKLGLDKSIRCGIGILEGHEGMETRSINLNSDGTLDLKTGMLNMSIHPMLVGLKKAWKNGKKGYSYEYTAKDVRKYYEALNKEPEYPFNADLKTLPKREFHKSFFYSSGIIFAFSETPISEESSKILARFAAVFGQTYQRFLDLQKAEERAKDAVKQASLDRVRGQIASMRSAEDLERITPLVFNELTTLGIPFIRCGVFIIEESNKTVQAFLSAPDGRSLGAMQIPFDAEKNTAETVAHWRKGEVYRTHWDKRQFLEFMQTMIDMGQVNNNKEYQGAEEPPESLHLHFVPFRQGMLYVGSEASLTVEQIELVQSLADAFAIAYARYEDFDKLEKAKERVETALSELKTTQNQLVQSEKMASLGELTAGIAHEIQNPLNFVNNFSEVSVELIEEMLEEIQKGDVEEVKALAEDIIQNLEKINHHGKRADGIVKGMLQHSRASSGEKEPTDINVLADEYLRLAYHGLRAKDKSFNATLETHFDESIGKVNVLPQDMGRVILNLITNAFYVVKEKSSEALAKGDDTYEPTVTVSTKKNNDGVVISVKDNGNGIPEGIKEKIFQPFFTTKPTGQGTGLGLSMSYDIITKGHGGEITIETIENEGSSFNIYLPL